MKHYIHKKHPSMLYNIKLFDTWSFWDTKHHHKLAFTLIYSTVDIFWKLILPKNANFG